MKKLFPLILVLLCSCAGVKTYQVGEYSVNVASKPVVNEEYQKVCTWYCDRLVNGFVNYRSKEMWVIPSIPTIMHEFKHISEGPYHAKLPEQELIRVEGVRMDSRIN